MFKQFYKLFKFRLLLIAVNIISLSLISDLPICFFICMYCFIVITLFLTYRYFIEEDGTDKVENTMRKEFLKFFLLGFLNIFGIVFITTIFEKNFYSIKDFLILSCFLVFFSVIIAFFRVRKKRKREQK